MSRFEVGPLRERVEAWALRAEALNASDAIRRLEFSQWSLEQGISDDDPSIVDLGHVLELSRVGQ